jgi:hypothetical protein
MLNNNTNNSTNKEINNNCNKNNKLLDEGNNDQSVETTSDPDRFLQITEVSFIQRIGAKTEQLFNTIFQ